MSDSDNNINDLASKYFDLWQKQLTSQSSDKMVEDALKSVNQFQEQTGEMMESLQTPEKMQEWMSTWSETWKGQFKDEQDPFGQFKEMQQNWAETIGAASERAPNNMDELEKRIATLEKQVAELESKLKG